MTRLIDADLLQTEFDDKCAGECAICAYSVDFGTRCTLIDNAPTVEPEKVLVANVTFDEDKLKEIVHTEVIEKIKSGELVVKTEERPQGEWEGGEIGYCTNCGHKGCASDIWSGCTGMFCPNCGTDLSESKE